MERGVTREEWKEEEEDSDTHYRTTNSAAIGTAVIPEVAG